MRTIVVCLILTIFLFGCDKIFPPQRVEPARTVSIKGPLLAKVGNWSMGLYDFDEKLDALKTLYPEAADFDAEAKKEILRELVNLEILSQEAEAKGLDREKDIVDAVRDFKRSLLAQRMGENITKQVTVTEIEVENFYNDNQAYLRDPEKRRVREIVVSSEKKAKDISIALLQGENFSSLARSSSVAESKSKGGDLGYITPDPEKKFPKFWDVVFATEEGQSSTYFQGPDGKYYIIKVEDVTEGKTKPLYEVQDEIREYLRKTKINQKLEDIISNAKQKYKVIINEDLLD